MKNISAIFIRCITSKLTIDFFLKNVIIIIEKMKGQKKMYRIKVQQKYCKCIRVIFGKSIALAFSENNLSTKFWEILEVEELK